MQLTIPLWYRIAIWQHGFLSNKKFPHNIAHIPSIYCKTIPDKVDL